jgi:hypothetical protein
MVVSYLEGVGSDDGIWAAMIADLVLDHGSRDAKAWDKVGVLGGHFGSRDSFWGDVRVVKDDRVG